MSAARFGRVVTAMITPFDDTGALDADGAATLARWLADNGTDALVLAGSTGESTVLTDAEKADLWRTVAEAVTIPVLAGVGTADTAHTIELARTAVDTGAAGLLVVGPYYSRPPQGGLLRHFEAVAGATDLPVVVYDVPARTGRRILTDTLVQLVRTVPNVVAVKDASGDPASAARMVAEGGDGFDLYSGDDALTLPLLSVGAVGVVSVASHWAGRAIGTMIDAFLAGRPDEARRANAALLASWGFVGTEAAPNPIPTKAMLRVLGLPAGQCRLPLGPCPQGVEEEARRVLAGLEGSGPGRG